jgi:hypothetical protein
MPFAEVLRRAIDTFLIQIRTHGHETHDKA